MDHLPPRTTPGRGLSIAGPVVLLSVSVYEVQAVRPLLAMTLFACMLGLAGCSLPKRLKGEGSSGSGQPFTGSPPADTSSVSEESSSSLASKANTVPKRGVLAGYVKDQAARKVARAKIEVVAEDAAKDAPTMVYETDKEGNFDISGLELRKAYRLTAKVRDGNRYLTGSEVARASNTRVLIVLTKEEVAGDKNSIEDKSPEKDAPKETTKETTGTPSSASGINQVRPVTPVEPIEAEQPLPQGSRSPEQAPPPKLDAIPQRNTTVPQPPPPETAQIELDLMAKEKSKAHGWDRNPPVPLSVGGPGHPKQGGRSKYAAPPLPGSSEELTPSAAPSADSATQGKESVLGEDFTLNRRPIVPSCLILGGQVKDFSLYDFDGRPWRFKEKREGNLILIDFWHSKCPPCRAAMPFLHELDRKYRKYGLQIIGIAHEKGTLAEKQDRVRPIREQSHMNYPTLFTGGGEGDCPVLEQFKVHGYPTVVLLDGAGRIVWRSAGLNEMSRYDLEMGIRRRLGFRDAVR